MNKKLILLIACAGTMAYLPMTAVAQSQEPPKPGTYYSAQRPWLPPLPYNPFPDLPTIEVEPRRFIYDDTGVDYEAMQTTSSGGPPPPPGEDGGLVPHRLAHFMSRRWQSPADRS